MDIFLGLLQLVGTSAEEGWSLGLRRITLPDDWQSLGNAVMLREPRAGSRELAVDRVIKVMQVPQLLINPPALGWRTADQ